jgi:hypothetical protein
VRGNEFGRQVAEPVGQCSSRMLPGLTVTRAAATALDAGKFVLSAMRMLPPLFSYTGFDCDMGFTVVVAVMTVAGSLLADIASTVLDPRVRYEGSA